MRRTVATDHWSDVGCTLELASKNEAVVDMGLVLAAGKWASPQDMGVAVS